MLQAFEDKYINDFGKETLRETIDQLDKVFNVIFFLEFLLKLTSYGIRRYFTDSWCLLDFTIVAVSMACIFSSHLFQKRCDEVVLLFRSI